MTNHNFVQHGSGAVAHLIKFINAAHTVVSQYEGTSRNYTQMFVQQFKYKGATKMAEKNEVKSGIDTTPKFHDKCTQDK